MSKIKIYDGVVIDMATSKIVEQGDISYVDSDQVAYTKGGDKTQVTNTGVDNYIITTTSRAASNSFGGGTNVQSPQMKIEICLLYTSPSPRDS